MTIDWEKEKRKLDSKKLNKLRISSSGRMRIFFIGGHDGRRGHNPWHAQES